MGKLTCIPLKELEVHRINAIADLYPDLRKESKAPTFALTYRGTWLTLVRNCGFTKEQAKSVEARYHELYKVSDAWVQDKLEAACKDGYITVAFGLRVRTPALKSAGEIGKRHTPSHVEAEGRTAGNACGQSYGLLNTRAAIAFQEIVLNSPYRYDILPVASIHDANYFMIRDDAEVVKFVNDHLVQEAEWQELDEIAHPQVKLGGQLSLFYPSWAEEYVIPNHASVDEIYAACQPKPEKE